MIYNERKQRIKERVNELKDSGLVVVNQGIEEEYGSIYIATFPLIGIEPISVQYYELYSAPVWCWKYCKTSFQEIFDHQPKDVQELMIYHMDILINEF